MQSSSQLRITTGSSHEPVSANIPTQAAQPKPKQGLQKCFPLSTSATENTESLQHAENNVGYLAEERSKETQKCRCGLAQNGKAYCRIARLCLLFSLSKHHMGAGDDFYLHYTVLPLRRLCCYNAATSQFIVSGHRIRLALKAAEEPLQKLQVNRQSAKYTLDTQNRTLSFRQRLWCVFV